MNRIKEKVNGVRRTIAKDSGKPFAGTLALWGTVPKGTAPHKGRAFFISGTDTAVGKTVAVMALGVLLQDQGLDVGIMKPIQCGGRDTEWLLQTLKINDPINLVNPYFAKEPVSPHIAFRKQRAKMDIERIKKNLQTLRQGHDVVLIEGAGGLMVPIQGNYLMMDLIRDLDVELILVARRGLGTINHTLLSIAQARQRGITLKGVLFNETQPKSSGIPEKTNPQAIASLGEVKILGTIPYLKSWEVGQVKRHCARSVDIRFLLGSASKRSTRHWQEEDKKYLWHPFTQMREWEKTDPLMIASGQGSYLIDTDGKRYLDGVSSLWVNVHGHGRKEMDVAIQEQLGRLSHSTLLGLSHPPAVELAKKLIDIAPRGLRRVFYSDNGSTAVEVALKMAYQYWQNIGKTKKTMIVHLANSYHGDTLGSVSVGGIDLFHRVYKKLIFKTQQIACPNFYRVQRGNRDLLVVEEFVNDLEKLFRNSHKGIAALIVEPLVQGAAGMIVWPVGILTRMKKLCTKYEIFLIADEVATGFGRTGKMFACHHEQVTPDFLCLAKGMTGGTLPLAATLVTEQVYQGFLFDHKEQKSFFHGHTYTGNPLACAAALANLKIFEKDRVLAKLQPKIKYLSQRLKMFYNLAHVGQVRQKGFMVGIELVKVQAAKTPYLWEEKIGVRVCQEARQRGVILRPLGNVIVLMPPLSISKEELDQLLDAVHWAIQQVTSLES